MLKYVIVIIDGASGWAIPEEGNKTCLEIARTPQLDALAREGRLGVSANIPEGMEPSSACACMSVLGYDPVNYYRGRSAIEAISMNVPVGPDEVVFRCNLVSIVDGKMASYSSGHIATREAGELVEALNKGLGNGRIRFYPGVSYRHICKLKGIEEVLQADCTPPHDIPNKPVANYLPNGKGSQVLRELIKNSEKVLSEHSVNIARQQRGEMPATNIWLFWGCGQIPQMPAFKKVYGLKAAMSSGVDLLKGLAAMMQIDVLNIPGVTDGLDNDYQAQAIGVIKALEDYDMVVAHIEAPDEAGHSGSVNEKVRSIEAIDREVIGRLRTEKNIRLLITPDHPTPVTLRTHTPEVVPFVMWGKGFNHNGGKRLTESEAKNTGFFIEKGCNIMHTFLESN